MKIVSKMYKFNSESQKISQNFQRHFKVSSVILPLKICLLPDGFVNYNVTNTVNATENCQFKAPRFTKNHKKILAKCSFFVFSNQSNCTYICIAWCTYKKDKGGRGTVFTEILCYVLCTPPPPPKAKRFSGPSPFVISDIIFALCHQ